jgi:transcription initiation factor TFIID subunit 5
MQEEYTICSMAVSDDVRWLAAGTADSCIQLYDLPKLPRAQSEGAAADAWEQQLADKDCVRYLWGHSGPVYGLSFGCDKRLMYSCGLDGTIRMWVTDMCANLAVWRGHMVPVWDVKACPRGHWFASAGADWVVKLWCACALACTYSLHPSATDSTLTMDIVVLANRAWVTIEFRVCSPVQV